MQDWDFLGPFWTPVRHRTRQEIEKDFAEPKNPGLEFTRYYIQKKDGASVGIAVHAYGSQLHNWMEIGYVIDTPERGKGYATEAVQILVDFLFLTRQLERIQAMIDTENKGSQRVIEKAGFSREGELRNAYWTRGKWKNAYMYSITRSEWKEPRVFERNSG
jgi:ribosomal-protein-alanine N-acetyltransferase